MTIRSDSDDRRHFHRILFDAPVTVTLEQASLDSRLIDISLKGALIARPEGWPGTTGGHARLKVELDGETSFIEMEARIAHSEAQQIGFQCVHIDMDSITHLRRLVELNLGDEQLLQRELEELV